MGQTTDVGGMGVSSTNKKINKSGRHVDAKYDRLGYIYIDLNYTGSQ